MVARKKDYLKRRPFSMLRQATWAMPELAALALFLLFLLCCARRQHLSIAKLSMAISKYAVMYDQETVGRSLLVALYACGVVKMAETVFIFDPPSPVISLSHDSATGERAVWSARPLPSCPVLASLLLCGRLSSGSSKQIKANKSMDFSKFVARSLGKPRQFL